MRGCFQMEAYKGGKIYVFPAHAGVFEAIGANSVQNVKSSPRMRGCFH